MRVQLFTRDGALVHEQRVPPFEEPPDVIIWGTRLFCVPSVDARPWVSEEADDVLTYVEADSYALVP